MGEIGYNRREYLYDLSLCDIVLITRGYWRRQHPAWERARLIAYNARYCMGVPKGQSAPTPSNWLPFPWEQEEESQSSAAPTPEEIAEIEAEFAALNQKSESDNNDS